MNPTTITQILLPPTAISSSVSTPLTTLPTNKTKFTSLSDSELYTLCKKYGSLARQARRKFAGLMLEVHRRRLHRRRGYASIYEFAAKQAGMSRQCVDTIFRIAKKIENKPALKEQLESGSQGWSKIERVAYIATPETDKQWAEKVKVLPKKALDVYVKEYRKGNVINNTEKTVDRRDFTKNQSEELFTAGRNSEPENKPLSREKTKTISFKVTPELEFKFRLFKHQLEKHRKETTSFSEVLEALLEKA